MYLLYMVLGFQIRMRGSPACVAGVVQMWLRGFDGGNVATIKQTGCDTHTHTTSCAPDDELGLLFTIWKQNTSLSRRLNDRGATGFLRVHGGGVDGRLRGLWGCRVYFKPISVTYFTKWWHNHHHHAKSCGTSGTGPNQRLWLNHSRM